QDGLLARGVRRPLLHVQGSRRRNRACLAGGRPTASRSEEQRAELSDRPYTPVRSRCRRQSAAFGNGPPRPRQGRGLRHRVLPRRPRADVGSRRRRELNQAAGIVPGRCKTFALVCHSSGALRHVKTPDGKPLVEGKTVTGFTNGEEEEVGLTKVVPFLVEDEL